MLIVRIDERPVNVKDGNGGVCHSRPLPANPVPNRAVIASQPDSKPIGLTFRRRCCSMVVAGAVGTAAGGGPGMELWAPGQVIRVHYSAAQAIIAAGG